MKLKITKYDIILIVTIVVISIFCICVSFYSALFNNDKVLRIYVEDELYKEYVLSDELNDVIKVRGKLYYTVVQIQNGKVFVKESDCPDKICQRHIAISRPGEMIVCLPNRVIIKIEGNSNDDLDYISQ